MNQVQVTLACSHTRRFVFGSVPGNGDMITCRFDGDQPVTTVHTYEWHVRCHECRYSRWMGQNETEARRLHRSHNYLTEHTVGVAYDRVTKNGKGTVFVTNGTRTRAANVYALHAPRATITGHSGTLPPPF